jgi:beta-lactamase regulating signal transducer with metallopeptidase domain
MSLTHLLSALGRLSIQAAVVVLVILLVQAVFRRWLTPRWRCALWLLLVARLLLPVSFESTASIFNLFNFRRLPPMPRVAVELEPIDVAPAPPTTTGDVVPMGGTMETREGQLRLDTSVSPVSVPAVAWPNSVFFWESLWLAGFSAFLTRVAFRSAWWSRRFAGSPKVTDHEVLEIVRECAERLGIRTQFAIYESQAVSSPVLYGAFRPRLVLPRGFVGRFTREETGFVVLHEMIHFKRGDLILNWLVTGLQAIHWFNPLVWVGFARWRADREVACDAAVLEAVGDGRSRNYGETIIQLLEGHARQAAIPGHVGVLEVPGDLRMRLLMITQFKPASRRSTLALLLLAGIGVICLTNARLSSPRELLKAVSSAGNSVRSPLAAPPKIARAQFPSTAAIPGREVLDQPRKTVANAAAQDGRNELATKAAQTTITAGAASGTHFLSQGSIPVTKSGNVVPGAPLARADSGAGRMIVGNAAVAAGVAASVVERGGNLLLRRPQIRENNSNTDDPIFTGGIVTPKISPELLGQSMAWDLKNAIDGLTTPQMHKIAAILIDEWADRETLSWAKMSSPATVAPIRKRALDQVRALLTPEQRVQFDLIPQNLGGGLVGMSPWDQLDRLNKLVHLTAAQKSAALEVYIQGTEILMENRAPDQAAEAGKIRVAMRKYISALLTPEQQKIWNAAPQTKGGRQIVISPKHQLKRLDAIVHLTSYEKVAALRIYQEVIAAFMRIPEAERPRQMPKFRQIAREKICAILTPAQLRVYDNTP